LDAIPGPNHPTDEDLSVGTPVTIGTWGTPGWCNIKQSEPSVCPFRKRKRTGVANNESFQEKIRRLGVLVGELEASPGGGSAVSARELVQLLMEVHGAGLERIMEIIDESGPQGEEIILKAGKDPVVRHLLLLYSLHPEDLETRVLRALDAAAPRLRKLNSEAELIDICEGTVRVRVNTSGHACGSTGRTVQSIVEECIYDQAPDLASLEILGQEDASSPGFVSLESLTKNSLPVHEMAAQGAD
jgi:Fe-S cluster biogenesis protein NfuA